jgi:hypothetical protein
MIVAGRDFTNLVCVYIYMYKYIFFELRKFNISDNRITVLFHYIILFIFRYKVNTIFCIFDSSFSFHTYL